MGNVVFLEPKLPQAPADTSRDCEFEYDDEYMESFFQKIDSIVRQIGIFETLKNEKVELSFSFNEQGEIFYCYFFFRSEQSLAKFNIQTLKEFVEKLILLKLDMQYIYINYNRLAKLGCNFTYEEFERNY